MARKRTHIALFAVDGALYALLAFVWVAALPDVAFAYVDPSVMTYTIQALAGVAVALSAVAGVAYRRVRRHMMSVLGIDENADKVVEPDVSRVSEGERAAEDARMTAFWRNAKKPGEAPVLGYRGRFVRALLVVFPLALSLFVATPFELVLANYESLVFTLGSVWVPLVVACVVSTAVVASLVALLRGRAFDVAAAVLAGIALLMWAQAMFMNDGLPIADGAQIAWGDYALAMVASGAVWVVVLGAAVAAALLRTKRTRFVASFVAVALVLVQVVGVTSLGVSQAASKDSVLASRYCITQDGMLDVGPGQNVIVFVLDMYDEAYLNTAMNAAPDIRAALDGFTWYRNATGSAIPTRFGIPYLLTGQMPQVGQTYSEYVATRYTNSTFLEDIAGQGFDVGVYTDTFGPSSTWESKAGIPFNIIQRQDESVDWPGTVAVLARTSLYRNMPWVAKPAFRYHTDLVNQFVIGQSSDLGFNERPYVMNDSSYFGHLKGEGLEVVDRGAPGSFRFIHLLGAHWPYVMNENGEIVDEFEKGTAQYVGSMRIVTEYLRQLKELGLFDSATIIITADHGYWQDTIETCNTSSNPIFLVKPAAGAGGGAGAKAGAGAGDNATTADAAANEAAGGAPLWAPLVEDRTTPTGHIDFPATVMAAVGGDYERYGTPVFMVDPHADRVRQYFYLKHDSDHNIDFELQEYLIRSNATLFSNWERTGNVLPNDDKRFHP